MFYPSWSQRLREAVICIIIPHTSVLAPFHAVPSKFKFLHLLLYTAATSQLPNKPHTPSTRSIPKGLNDGLASRSYEIPTGA
ncbi:hypothetical protein FKM82_028958 [Ascaphus truei]